jgi:large subunit ribosomal protein L19
MNLLEKYNEKQIAKLNKNLPDFAPGDTIKVDVRIVEGANERIQSFEGICIAIRRRGIATSFRVRKVSHGEGVERIFPLYSPRVANVTVTRYAKVRRAKLYYLRDLQGKAARIKERRVRNNNA